MNDINRLFIQLYTRSTRRVARSMPETRGIRSFIQLQQEWYRATRVANAGMTLMEVLIVLALILIAMGAVVPNLIRIYERDSANRVIHGMSSILGQARTMAIDSASVYLFRCHSGESTYEVLDLGDSDLSLDASTGGNKLVAVRSVLRGELSSDFRFVSDGPIARDGQQVIGVYWLPDGTSTSQCFGVMDRSGKRHWIAVDALTGEISKDRKEQQVKGARNG